MTRKFIQIFLLSFIFSTAYAATNPIITVNNQATVNVGYLPTQIENSPILDNSRYLKGNQRALDLTITKTFQDRFYTQTALTGMGGNYSYGNNTPRTGAGSTLLQGDLRFGYIFFPTSLVGLTPYATLGYQYWQLDTGGRDIFRGVSRNGATKFYQNGFFGLGLLSQFILQPRLVFNIDALVGKSFNPWVRYNAPDVPNAIIGRNIIYQSAFLLPEPFYQIDTDLDYAINQQIHVNGGIQYSHREYSSVVTSPSNLREPHLSLSAWNYHIGAGFSLEPEDKDSGMQRYFYNQSDTIIRANNQASVWLGYILQQYAETLPNLGHYFDRQVGNIPVLNLAINKTFQQIYTLFNLSIGGGTTAYKGQSSTGSDYVGTSLFNTYTRNTFLDTSIRLGYMFFPQEKLGLIPYISGGFHRWLRDTAGIGQNGFLTSGYPETYQHAWYALGLLTQMVVFPDTVVNVDANFGTTQNAQNRSWNSFESPPSFQQAFTLKQRFTYNLGIGSDYRFARNWHALAQINYWYFKYGLSSSSRLGIFEPNSTTRQISIMLGIGYALDASAF